MAHSVRLLWRVLPSLLVWGVLAGLPCKQAFSQTRLAVFESVIQIPAERYFLTPYFNRTSGELVLHLQPRNLGSQDILIDARTGSPWGGDPGMMLSTYSRLGSESSRDVRAGSAFDQKVNQRIGCLEFALCTSPADAEVTLFLDSLSDGRFRLRVVDLRPMLRAVEALLSGEGGGAGQSLTREDWLLVELFAKQPDRQALWTNSLRSIDSIAKYEAVEAVYKGGPRLMDRNLGPLDLKAELEFALIRVSTAHALRQWSMRRSAAELKALVNLIDYVAKPGFEAKMLTYIVGALASMEEPDRTNLAMQIKTLARQERLPSVVCVADWMLSADCTASGDAKVAAGQGAPAVNEKPTAPKAERKPSANPGKPEVKPRDQAPEGQVMAGGTGIRMQVPGDGSSNVKSASNAQQEWAIVQTLPNKLVLLSFQEETGKMQAEGGAAAGLAFVARSLGNLQEGRFEIQMTPNGRAPVKLAHGAYRVTVTVSLDFTREDQCVSGALCMFRKNELFAKTEKRSATFSATVSRNFVDRKVFDFGHLLPLSADGGGRYKSVLKQARLAVDSVRFDLL